MGKYIEKIVFIVCGICTLLLVLKIGPGVISFIQVFVKKPTLTYCEMTEREREFLKAESDYQEADVKRYEEGMLYSSEMKELEWVRQLYADLEERYPGYQFYISYKTHGDLFRPNGYYKYFTEEETTGRTFYTYIFYDDQWEYGHEQDSFYGYFVEEEYAEYLKEQLEKRQIENVVKVKVEMPHSMGKEYNSSMTVDDIISRRLDVAANSDIFIKAGSMTEKDCEIYAEEVRDAILKINRSGSYNVYFCDMEEEEILETISQSGDIKSIYYFWEYL